MITVKFVGGPAVTVNPSDTLTAGQMIQGIKDSENLEFKGLYTLQDTINGRYVQDDEIVVDGRLYFLNVWYSKREQ